MSDTKYRWNSLCLYDYRGVEDHLSAMAAKGWRLEKAGNNIWKYRRAEPAKVRYAATYSAGASQFNPGPTEGQQSLAELCRAAGWEKTADWFQMQIFHTQNPNAVPLETDEALRLENIHRSMRKNFLPANIVLLVLGLLRSVSFLGTLVVNPLRILQSNGSLFSGSLLVLVAILETYTLCHYYLWRRRSLRSVAEGGPCVPLRRGYQQLNRAGLVLLGALTVLYLLAELLTGNTGLPLFYLAYVPMLLLLMFLVRRTTALLRKLKASKRLNILGTLAVDLLLAFALTGGITYGTLHFGWFFNLGGDTYEYRGQEWDVHPPQDVPMTLSDLTGVDYRHVRRRRIQEGSLLLPHTRYQETVLFEDGPVRQLPLGLDYEIWTPRLSWLRDALLEDILEPTNLRLSGIPHYRLARRYEEEDPGPWNAEAAYRRYWNDSPTDSWLLVWPHRVASVSLDLEEPPTDRQKALITAYLAPGA